MEINYSNIISNVEDSTKRVIIKEGLKYNKSLFMEIRRTLPKSLKFKGFNSVSKIGFGSCRVLAAPIFDNKLYSNDKTAALLLKGYFYVKKQVVSTVSETLNDLGYEIVHPDFIGEKIKMKSLRDEDVFELKNEFRYFRPNGKKIVGIKDEEATIISALLGWIVLPDEEKEESDETTVKVPADNKFLDNEKQQNKEKTMQPKQTAEGPIKETDKTPSNTIKKNSSIDAKAVNIKESDTDPAEQDKDEIEHRIKNLKNEFLKSSETLTKISEDLRNGRIPDNYNEAKEIHTLKNRFDKLIAELGFEYPGKTHTIRDIEEEYKRIREERNQYLFIKVINVLKRYRKIYHVKGEDFSFFHELNKLAEKYEKSIKSNDAAHNEEWVLKFKEGKHLFNHLNEAVEIRLNNSYNETELDVVLDQLELECEENNFNFSKILSRQIDRGNLAFSIDTETTPPEKGSKTGKKSNEIYSDEEIVKSGIDSKNKSNNEQIVTNQKAKQIDETKEVKIKKIVESIDEENKIEEEAQTSAKELVSVKAKNFKNEKKDSGEEQAKDTIPKVLVEKVIEKTTTNEDSYILKLLKRDEPELAYHLALCYENENTSLLLPSWLLQNLFLSLKMRTASAPIAQKIISNLDNFQVEEKESPEGLFKNQILFASILRPSLLAYSSNPSFVLNEIYSGKTGEFSGIKRVISNYMSRTGGILNFDILSQISGENDLQKNKDKFRNNIKEWLERAEQVNYRGKTRHFFSITFNNWVKNAGWINQELNNFIKKDEISVIIKLLDELDEARWSKRFEKDLRKVIGKSQYRHGNTDAEKWFKNHIDDLKELLNEGLNYYPIHTNNSFDYDIRKNDLTEFVKELIEEIEKAKVKLNETKNDNIFNEISFSYLVKAFDNVANVLTTNERIGQPLVSKEIENTALLRLPYYESDPDWFPIHHDKQLANAILQYISSPGQSINNIAKKHLQAGNYEAFNRLRTVFQLKDTVFEDNPDEQTFKEKIEFEFRKVIYEIERGGAYGYIMDKCRSTYIASLEEIENNYKNNSDGVNYPLRKVQVESVLSKIEEKKKEFIDDSQKLLPKNLNIKQSEILNGFLEKGNILAFNEALERSRKGQPINSQKKSEDLKIFYQDFLTNQSGKDFTQLIKAIDEKNSYHGVNFSQISDDQAKKVIDLIKRWYYIKNNWDFNKIEQKLSIELLLEFLGFTSINLDKPKKEDKSYYFDFTCNIISGKDKTPIPEFGSYAKGNYRLICISEKYSEDEIVEEIKRLSPETNRAVIVFYFAPLNKQKRLELLKKSKRNRITYLLMDKAILAYLSSLKESKFPIFVKLAAPLSYAEPYQTAASNLPEEMFYGRGPQIEKLKNIIGDYACLIYGGRQLGKTVLQKEVKRIFNNPDKNNYSIYVDLRDNGIGLWKPTKELPSVLIENLKNNIPGLFPERIQSSSGMPYLRNRILKWFEMNPNARIILFLDESDRFLEQDAQQEWPHILPLKGLMEKTEKKFKVVLSGLHDVRRTSKIPNNPLAHFGSPICVGSMLTKEEANEAQLLIRLPLETLGYQFESNDLVYMILSHCNWYPSLIQIFCSSLLNILYDKKNIKQLPIPITEKDVTKAYEKSHEQIKLKFKLTLNLDEKYDLLANIIANETIEDSSIQTSGISVEYIADLATIAWPAGFDSTNPKIEVNDLLEEMVDLGILRTINSHGMFALRTPNLLGLIGTNNQIRENIDRQRKLPTKFDRNVSRIIYKKGNREIRSPFPAIFYDDIINPNNKVVVFKGSKMGGINYIHEFLESRKREIHIITTESLNLKSDSSDFWKLIDRKRVPGKHNIILLGPEIDFTFEDILTINTQIGKRESLSAVFIMDPNKIWNITNEIEKAFVKLENQNIKVINMPQWRKDIAKEWYKEAYPSANIDEIFNILSNWHFLLEQFHGEISYTPELWEEKLKIFAQNRLINNQNILSDFGILNQEMIRILKELVVWDGGLTKQEFFEEYSKASSRFEGENYFDYFSGLSLLDNEIKVDPIVKTILSNG
ncbi:hypothetical protein BMS3Abin03_01353 [bacterium BMS3Abin03]|nr:hypothetical protein BMS3Abin03_01353 [bacterium BMS3Abin03]